MNAKFSQDDAQRMYDSLTLIKNQLSGVIGMDRTCDHKILNARGNAVETLAYVNRSVELAKEESGKQ